MERYDLPAEKLATPEEAGVLRVAAETDEKNCGCNDAAVTPKNLYSLLDYRKASTAYTAGAIVACPYHKEFLLKCTTGGTTSANSIDTKAVTKGSVITDGGVKWTVIASQIIDVAISGTIITVTFIDGTQKTLTTQDTTGLTASQSLNTQTSEATATSYCQLSNGLLIQYGKYVSSATRNQNGTITFPKAFSDIPTVLITPLDNSDNSVASSSLNVGVSAVKEQNTTNFVYRAHGHGSNDTPYGIFWIAIGKGA